MGINVFIYFINFIVVSKVHMDIKNETENILKFQSCALTSVVQIKTIEYVRLFVSKWTIIRIAAFLNF